MSRITAWWVRALVWTLRLLVPTVLFTVGLSVMVLAVPLVIWAFMLRLPPHTRLKLGLFTLGAGAAITSLAIGLDHHERHLVAKRYHRLKRR